MEYLDALEQAGPGRRFLSLRQCAHPFAGSRRSSQQKITWWQAAEILGISDRHMRRWRERYEEFGFRGLFDRRRGRPSPKRVYVAWSGFWNCTGNVISI